MSMYIVEYDPTISGKAHTIIEKNVQPEMENQETAIYNIVSCIEELIQYRYLASDVKYLQELADHDTHARDYIEF